MPTDALIIVRIYDINSDNPKVAFFADPWSLYTNDMLEFQCDGIIKGQPAQIEDTK
jgi:hypothetical protein